MSDGPQDDPAELLKGLTVDGRRPEQPVLLDERGRPLETWRENYPYERRMRRREYEQEKRILQIELLKMQRWVRESGQRLVVLCEGRDAAGKGGTIQRFTERLNPAGRAWSPWRSRPSGKPGSGTSSGTWAICPPPARSSSSTGPGTTGPGWSG
ncbi:hypothetical protein Smic_71630 [Streptomyces microflavus]|uniref:Polyphosphate kinase-2-related domain-containing protein n=1 Tax=Streptomyces microflavus TaxID=1919 RepID=A0A7J0D3F9_STRMI|nr:hypothetical protein Smic_71630 [Streptomyces microflavus]